MYKQDKRGLEFCTLLSFFYEIFIAKRNEKKKKYFGNFLVIENLMKFEEKDQSFQENNFKCLSVHVLRK